MRSGNPVEAVASALYTALARDLPDIEYDRKIPKHGVAYRDLPTEKAKRRPYEHEVDVVLFPQTWGSTALGYGGIGGASVTLAYTVVVSSRTHACVYFGGPRLAYRVNLYSLDDKGAERWHNDITNHSMAACDETARYSKRKEP